MSAPGPSAVPTSEAQFTAAFDVVKELGRGRFGEVMLVQEKAFLRAGGGGAGSAAAKTFALKRTGFGSAGQPGREKVEVEAKALERLQHPNVIRHHAAWPEEKHFCIMMEYAECGDFGALLSRRWAEADAAGEKALDEDEVMGYFVQLADGLAHVHERKVVHRDLKPENIFLSGAGNVKVEHRSRPS